MKRKVLVTGGAGFIGSNLAQRLLSDGDTVFIVDDLSTGFRRNIPGGAAFIEMDASSEKEVSRVSLPEIDVVFHLAAQSSGEASFDDPLHDIDVNYRGTYNVLKLAHDRGCKRFIFTSSMSVYGETGEDEPPIAETHPCIPRSYYGCNKLASEHLIQVFCTNTGMRPTVFRLFNVYGPGQNMGNMKQGMVSIYLSYLMRERLIEVKGGLDRFRDFVFVDDVVHGLVDCVDNEEAFDKTFNLGTGVKTTVKQLLATLLAIYGKTDFEQSVKLMEGTPGDIRGSIANTEAAHRFLEWFPTYSLQEGLSRMKAWIDQTQGWWNHESG